MKNEEPCHFIMEMNNNTNMNEGVFKKNILPQPKFIQYCSKIVITKYLIRSVSVFKCVYGRKY